MHIKIKPKRKKLENCHLAKMAGKTTRHIIKWISFKEERPPEDTLIFIIVKLDNGYYPVTGLYIVYAPDPKNRWEYIRFDDDTLPETYFNTKDEKRLIAWGRLGKNSEEKTI